MKRPLAAIAAAAALLAAAATASSAPEMTFLEKSQTRVSIDLRDSDVVDVLKFLSQKGKFNIYVSPRIQGRVTLYLENVRIADILDIILLSNGLAHREKDGIVYVMTQEEYRARYGQDYDDARDVRLLRLKYAQPSQIFKMLEPTKSSVGRLVVDEQTGTIVLMETPEKLKLMLDIIAEMDQPLETRIFDLSYAKAADVQTLLSSQESKGVASAAADTRSNQIVVTAFPARMREIEKIIDRPDRKTREVAIDTQIVKIVLNDDYFQGVDWRYVFQSGLLNPLDINVELPQTLDSSFGSLTYATFGSNGFEGVYNFLKTLGESKILASPRLTVVEGEEAKILIGTREAYVTTTTTTGSSTSTTAEAISFIDVGISLIVSPLINKDGYVTMKIKPEVSSVVRTLVTPSDNEIPIVDTTQAETRVMVKDGATIVIGGLRKDEKQSTVNKISGFGDLPLVGKVFQSNSHELEQTELIVFLTPRIIEGDKNAFDDPVMRRLDVPVLPEGKTAVLIPAAAAADPSAMKGIQAYPEPPGSLPDDSFPKAA